MNQHIRLDGFGPVLFDAGLPAVFAENQLPYADSIYARGPWGYIVVQEIVCNQCTVRYFIFRLLESLSFRMKELNEGFQSLISLRGSFDYDIEGLEPQRIGPTEYIILNAGEEDTRAKIKKGETALLNIYYKEDSYARLIPFLREFEKDIKRSLHKAFYVHKPRVARYTVLDSINALFHDQYVADLNKVYVEKRMECSLISLIADNYSTIQKEEYNQVEYEFANKAREMILADIKIHIPIEVIAAELNCTGIWLKRVFKKVYGMGMFQMLRRTRMEKARDMLIAKDHLKNITDEIGMNTSNFPKEFKSFFGYTVSQFKKGLKGLK